MPIFDQGYQHWRGPLSGHAWRWLTIARQGVRVQMKNRLLRLLIILTWMPAVALVAAVVLWGLVEQQRADWLSKILAMFAPDIPADPHAYRTVVWTLAYSFFFKVQIFFIMLVVALAGPGLISQDLRFNALPMYFARPLTRLDYFVGKLGVIGTLVAWVAVGPAVFAYVLGACFSLDLSVVRETYPVLLASVVYGLVITLSVGTLMLALSSLSRRSLYIGIAWAGLWLISSATATILTTINAESRRLEGYETEMLHWVAENPPPPGTKMFGSRPVMQFDSKTRKYGLVGVEAGHEKEAERWHEAWGRAAQKAGVKSFEAQGEARRNDWRPLFSYVGNLERLADQLLDTDSAWVTIGRTMERARAMVPPGFGPRAMRQREQAERAAQEARRQQASGAINPKGVRPAQAEPPVYERRLADQMVPQYPWVWSAGVLAVLLGLSTCILTRRVKSLDRLR